MRTAALPRRGTGRALAAALAAICLTGCATGGAHDPSEAEEPAPVEEEAPLPPRGSETAAPGPEEEPPAPPAEDLPGEPASPGSVTPGEEFVLRPGEEAAIQGTGGVLAFTRMISDSRCPRDTLCVWAGEVALELEWTMAGEASETLRVAGFPPVSGPTASGHTVTVVQVDPYPEQGRRFDPESCRATLKVTGADQGQGDGEGGRSEPSDSYP